MQQTLDLPLAAGVQSLQPSILAGATRQLADALDQIQPPEGIRVYNPLVYGRVAHERYLSLAASGPRPVLFVGMNPGPHGMVQTAVPFGDVVNARAIQALAGSVEGAPLIDRERLPALAHLRPIEGYSFSRKEVSGTRFWSEFAPVFWAAAQRAEAADYRHFPRYIAPAPLPATLERAFVLNICPLAFFGAVDPLKGPRSPAVNITPDKLPKPYREQVLAPCREYFGVVLRSLRPWGLVCFGGWAEKLAATWVRDIDGQPPRVEKVHHPSPRVLNTAAGWHPAAALAERGFWRHVGIE